MKPEATANQRSAFYSNDNKPSNFYDEFRERLSPLGQAKESVVPKLLYKVDLGNDTGSYLVTDGGRFLFYNLDGIFIATVPPGWQLVESLGMVETADDFERLTGGRPELFLEDCRVCGQPALLLVEHDDGVCVDCQPERGEQGIDYVN